jgi:hypothetical protein
MAVTIGPSIVNLNNGLVLHLDAGNRNSYSGSGTVWYDLSLTRNNATLINSPAYVNSGTFSYFSFNGVNTYATLTNVPPVAQSTLSSTVEVITYRTSTATFEVFFGGGNANGLNQGYYFGFRSGSDNFMHAYYSNDQDGSTPRTNVAWNQYVAVFDNSSGARYRYFNNQLLSPSQSSGVTNSSSTYFTIGAFNLAGSINTFYNGGISVVKIYNRALSATEIDQNYQAFRDRYGI